jgi:hypothetical protein
MTQKAKARLFFGLLILMLSYVMFIFYVSEPTYTSNIKDRPLKPFDFVSVQDDLWRNLGDDSNYQVNTGIVLQTDGTKALVSVKGRYLGSDDELYELKLKDHKYRLIGEGTFYHKVNYYVGFNLMIITQVIIGGLLGILLVTQIKLLSDLL